MITKVTTIKDFGIYKNFSWNTNINSFSKKNLIYGWNYSGKTTFSKLFNNLEEKKKTNFPSSQYTFEISRNSTSYNQDNLIDFPHIVKLFNSEYIKNVFSFDSKTNDGFNPISFYLGDEAGEIQPKIDKLKLINSRYESLITANYQIIVNNFNDYSKNSGKFSSQASEIRKYLNNKISDREFHKGSLITIVENIKSDLESFILPIENIEEIRQQSIAENIWNQQNESYQLNESIQSITDELKTILNDFAVASIPFPELDKDENLFNWVQTGVNLHEDSDNCKFCGQEYTTNRKDALNKYYSEKLKQIQNLIVNIRQKIELEKDKIEFIFPHESSIATHLQEKYKISTTTFFIKHTQYKNSLKVIELDLKNKENNYFTAISITDNPLISIKSELESIIEIIKEHNLFVANFENSKTNSLKKILNHYVAEYLISEDYLKKERKSTQVNQDIIKCQRKVKINESEVLTLEAKLKDTVKGQEELNTYLEIFLNRQDIKIIIERDKYSLKRGNFPATNLSEGEKTAIAFAYFLTELKSLKIENKLQNTIIYIDDPISSLDSNHIFQVRSLINHFFQNIDEYLQLFISTHNFEFFSVLLDSNLFSSKNKRDTRDENCPFYLIHRTNDESSIIRNLPKTLRSHKSEYAHLFYILKNYNEITEKEDFEFKILLPNALRRFLELYSLFKFPKGYSEIDERIKKIFELDDKAYHNTKLYHWFSHQNQLEKVATHDSKIILIDNAISEVLEHIKLNDKLHWEGLTGEVL
jgi:wobble nucleotide-excising tRNase